MPDLRTEITEIVTGLGMIGFPTLEEALASRPLAMINVERAHWDRLAEALASRQFEEQFARAWSNGVAFLEADAGLRNRKPIRVEWKGRFPTPGYDLIPADLRVDHVFLVSCKYLSRILFNVSPSHLFDRVLADRHGGNGLDWYLQAVPDAYRSFYDEVRRETASELGLPAKVEDLTSIDRDQLKQILGSSWPSSLQSAYRAFCSLVSVASADHWRSRLTAPHAREEMLWRLLRFAGAPYFVLGSSPTNTLRLRIYTPWDWRQEFSLRTFEVWGDTASGQPLVRWKAIVRCHSDGVSSPVEGHVEVRWSHGRFCGNPEAKIYLDTSHDRVPGYLSLR